MLLLMLSRPKVEGGSSSQDSHSLTGRLHSMRCVPADGASVFTSLIPRLNKPRRSWNETQYVLAFRAALHPGYSISALVKKPWKESLGGFRTMYVATMTSP